MFSTAKLVAVAVLILAPLDSLASRIYRRMEGVRAFQRDDDPQSSLTLDPRVIQPSGELTGQEGGGDPGQVASLTSPNNFINFCLTQSDVPLTDGQQIPTGSCNPIPMGRIAAKDKQPSAKFVYPPNLDESLTENQPFTMVMAINNMVTGLFANPNLKYYSAPQTVDGTGLIQGHSHVVIQALPSLTTTQPLDPNVFAFFKGLNDPAQGGTLSADVPTGLPAGAYRMCSINSSTNHQPVLVNIAQHGSLDDCSYFTVKPAGQGGTGGSNNNDGGNNNNGGGNNNNDGGSNNNDGGNNNNDGGNNSNDGGNNYTGGGSHKNGGRNSGRNGQQ